MCGRVGPHAEPPFRWAKEATERIYPAEINTHVKCGGTIQMRPRVRAYSSNPRCAPPLKVQLRHLFFNCNRAHDSSHAGNLTGNVFRVVFNQASDPHP